MTIKKILISAVFCLTLSNCNATADKSETNDRHQKSIEQEGKKFFDYDEIDYYISDFDEEKLGDLYDNQSKSIIDSLKMGIMLGSIPNDISDLSFIDKLEKVGYIKSSVDKSKFPAIDKIFVEKSVTENFLTACIYIYRDILIFKKNKKVVGSAKICFGCMANEIKGSSANTENFGMDGDYEKLGSILRK